MNCPHCQRPVRLFNFQRSSLLKKVLPRCGACHRYVLLWGHKAVFGALILLTLAILLWLLKLL
jgi:hypothetical protein